VIAALGAASITAIGATTDLTAVPGSFADVAAVQTYLAGANVVPRVESRLDVIEAQSDLISGQVNSLNAKVDALIAALKVAGIMASS
jgi:outer membrane murein-binding lipoprotein Lpp